MKYATIKNCGEFGIEFENIKGAGARVSREFIRKLLKRIVKRSTRYYEETGDHVFIYGEKQLHSVVCPSIADITFSYLMEHPSFRKPAGEEEYLGSVDYWISYKGYSFLMELKHTYFAYRYADNPRKSIVEKFEEAIKQLRIIRKNECKRFIENNKGLFKVALETVVFYEGSNNRGMIEDLGKQNFRTLFKKLLDNTGLSQKVNFHALWILNKRLIDPFNYEGSNGSYFEIYPAVAFVGKISQLINF